MFERERRRFLLSAAAVAALPTMAVRQVEAGVLDVGVHESGPADGRPVILLHGFPYDIHSYGPRRHRRGEGAGHNLPQDAPAAFAGAVAGLARGARWRT